MTRAANIKLPRDGVEAEFRRELASDPFDQTTRDLFADWLEERDRPESIAVRARPLAHFAPAFDKRHPDPAKNFGIHGVEARFVLRGKEGAVQFVLFTNWQLPEVAAEMIGSNLSPVPHSPALCQPMAADLGYHSPQPMWDSQTVLSESCEYLGGRPCYYDGSSLNAEPVLERLLREGHAGIWDALEAYYLQTFGKGEAGHAAGH